MTVIGTSLTSKFEISDAGQDSLIGKWSGAREAVSIYSFLSDLVRFTKEQQEFFSIICHGNLDQLNDFLLENDREKLRTPEVVDALLKLLYVLGGQITRLQLEEIANLPEIAFEILVDQGYINADGHVQQKFRDLMIESQGNKQQAVENMKLPKVLENYKTELFELIERNLDYKIRAFASLVLVRLSEAQVFSSDFKVNEPDRLLQILKEQGYLTEKGLVGNKFRVLASVDELTLPSAYEHDKTQIFAVIHEIMEKAKFSKSVYEHWREAIDEVDGVAMAADDKHAVQCDSMIRILGTYPIREGTFGIDYVVKLKDDGCLTRPMIRPLNEWYCIINGIVKVVLEDPETAEKMEVMAGQGDIVHLPKGWKAQFASMGPAKLKMLVPTFPSFESVDPSGFIAF